jgi:hypothetical protein
MEGFTKLPKMQCFKEGGTVKAKNMCYGGKMKEGGKADIAQDKAVVKKAFKMHDAQEHEGEKTDLSKLRKGGRAKKACGTVKKYKAGGSVTNVYEAKKSSGDKDNIRKVKDIAPTKAAAPSKAATKPAFLGSDVAKEKSKPSGHEDPYIKSKQSGKKAAAPSGAKGPDAYKKGGKVKKMADGGSTMDDASSLLDPIRAAGTTLRNNVMGTPEQNRIAQARMDMIAKKKAAEKAAMLGGLGNSMALQQGALAGQGAVSDNERAALTRMAPTTPAPGTMPMQKRGGKVKKCAEGGSLKEVDANENPGLSKLPTAVRNKMGYAKKGGKIC